MLDTAGRSGSELDVIFGEFKDQEAVPNFVASVREAQLDGTLYIGYPVLSVDDEKIEFDALLVSETLGVIVFDLYSLGVNRADSMPAEVAERQEKLYAALYNRLNSFAELRRGRSLAISITTVAVHPVTDTAETSTENVILGLNRIHELKNITSIGGVDALMIEHLNAAVQRISNLKPQKKRENVTKSTSKGAIIKDIEKRVANLDLWQKRGSIEYVNGPQRIRGLAGSGKTVVLALKAAYLHVKRPEWNIAITFYTRSLYQQFENLVTKFVYSQIGEEPDWSKIHIMHAWGGGDRPGVYREYCERTGSSYFDFSAATRTFGYDSAFKGACDQAIRNTADTDLDVFDLILIDEAQDLPSTFFQIVYRMTKRPRRIVWAYDDLQNLTDVQLPSASDLFGLSPSGVPRVTLSNDEDRPQQDIVLPRCYRNPPWTLLTAHGLGFGVHRQPMAQMFTDPSIWVRLGYEAESGELGFNHEVEIVRASHSIPGFFQELLQPNDTLMSRRFESVEAQYDWVVNEIRKLLNEDELQASDILLVLPNVRHSKSEGAKMLRALANAGLMGHIPGQTASRDELFREDSIAITHIYRAKGNEAPVVFVLNADFCESAYGIKQRRNILFTAITRSRAWTYIVGVGEPMDQIIEELQRIKDDGYSLDFRYPSQEEAQELAVSTDAIVDESLIEDFEELKYAIRKAKGNWSQIPLELRREIENLGRDQSR